MTQVCTCGARPPEDALFCHRCGRPLRELVAPEPAEEIGATNPILLEPPAAPTALAGKNVAIGLKNPFAVRVGLGAAAVVILLQMLPLPIVLQPIWVLALLLAGGFLAVYVYHRKTGEFLSLTGGARLGWITGLFVFLITLVIFTFSLLVVASQTGIKDYFREMLARRDNDQALRQLDSILSSSEGSAALIFATLLFIFVFFTVLSSLGGALAAKVLQKD